MLFYPIESISFILIDIIREIFLKKQIKNKKIKKK
ncbi:hypothetical protein SDC9_30545 [bioreactor metagenome]|uniref:Uncharacterized protein n=1 Tax=bioreactor metagenome TaxID=1076179 RepID=A0A644UZS9_9ZZZZ